MLTMYFTAIFLALFRVSTAGFSYVDKAPNPGACSQPYPEYIVYPQCNPTSGSIFSNEPSVTMFTCTFRQAVYHSDILRQVFDLNQISATQYSEIVRKFVEGALNHYGISDADSLAEYSVRAIVPNFDTITMPLLVRIKGNTVGNFLFVEGILTVDNAERLALTYAETIENHASVAMTQDPISKIHVLDESFIKYILSVDKTAVPRAPILTYYLGTEWFLAAVNYF